MAICPLPYFPLYAGEMLADEDFLTWTPAARGCWITLVARCWRDGSIPDDAEALSKLCACSADEMPKHWASIACKFLPHPSCTGRLISPRIEEERSAAISQAEKIKARGRAGAAARWKEKEAMPKHCRRNASAMLPDGTSPTPSSKEEKEGAGRVLFSFPCRGKREYHLTQADLDSWKESFPELAPPAEARRMRLWLQSQTGNIPSPEEMPRFICAWLNKSQDKQRNAPAAGAVPGKPSSKGTKASAMADPVPTMEELMAGMEDMP